MEKNQKDVLTTAAGMPVSSDQASITTGPVEGYTLLQDASFAPPAVHLQAVLDRHERPAEDADFIQPGELYRRVLNKMHKDHLVHNIDGHLKNAKQNIQYRQTALFYKADADWGTQVAGLIGLDRARVAQPASLSQEERVRQTI